MLKIFFEKYFTKSIFGILDQVFSSLLIFGINFYFAYRFQFNEVGIFAIVFSSIGIAQVLQQAILERPFLIKKNVFRYKTVVKRFFLGVLVLIISILISFYGGSNTSSVKLNENFIVPWFFLGIVQLLFNLGRVYFYTIKKEYLAFYISFTSTTLIFISFLLIGPRIEDQLFPYILSICLIKTTVLILFFRQIELVDNKFLTEDGSNKDYIFLILISLSIYLRTRYPIFYLAEYAFTLAGIFEVCRTITELVIMPFRPLSQSLLSYLSEKSSYKIKENFIKLISTFFLAATVTSSILYFVVDFIFSFLTLEFENNQTIKLALVFFVLVNVITIPFNAFLLSEKKFFLEFLVKIIPAFLMILFLILIEINNSIEIILVLLAALNIVELFFAVVFSIKTLSGINLNTSI